MLSGSWHLIYSLGCLQVATAKRACQIRHCDVYVERALCVNTSILTCNVVRCPIRSLYVAMGMEHKNTLHPGRIENNGKHQETSFVSNGSISAFCGGAALGQVTNAFKWLQMAVPL